MTKKHTLLREKGVSYSNIVKQGKRGQTVKEAMKMIIFKLENLSESNLIATQEHKSEKNNSTMTKH